MPNTNTTLPNQSPSLANAPGNANANANTPGTGFQSLAPYEEAYRAVAHEIAAVPEATLLPVNIDIVSAVISVRGALPEIRAMRPEFQRVLGDFDLDAFDKLETYALALFHLNARYRMATAPAEPLQALVERATELRDLFVADMTPLARRGLIAEATLRNRPRGPGYRNLVDELYALVAELRASWERVRQRSGIQVSEVEEAELLVDRIAVAVGLREQGPSANVGAATLERQRAFTLFVKAYEATRRAVVYLRHDAEVADAIAPSLYAGRGGRRRNEPETEPAQAAGASFEPFTQPGASAAPTSAANAASAAGSIGSASSTGSVGGAPSTMPAFPALARLAAEDPFLPR